VNRGVWEKDEGQYDDQRTVFGACGGAAAYRRAMLEEISLFDEDFVMYCEDVDLAFRAQLAGYGCIFAPGAVVYHQLSATGGGPLASYYCGRNFISVVAKNMPASLLRKYWPSIVGAQMGYLGESLRHVREPAARARLRGQLAGILLLPKMWRKRRAIKARRKASDTDIAAMLS
jgi:GT2 family glycosyltransferase